MIGIVYFFRVFFLEDLEMFVIYMVCEFIREEEYVVDLLNYLKVEGYGYIGLNFFLIFVGYGFVLIGIVIYYWLLFKLVLC